MWGPDRRWECDVCNQRVEGYGPWCDLYCRERRDPCRPLVKRLLNEADAAGDGPMVDVLCAYGRRRWGPDLDW
jgi:hypothetical protein